MQHRRSTRSSFVIGRFVRSRICFADPDLELSVTGACSRVAEQLGINRDILRGWVKQAQIDARAKPGLSTDQIAGSRSSRRRTVRCGERMRS